MTRTAEILQYTDKTLVMIEDIEIVQQFIKDFEYMVEIPAMTGQLGDNIRKFCVRFGPWDTFKTAVEGLINQVKILEEDIHTRAKEAMDAENALSAIKTGVKDQITYLENIEDVNEDNWQQIDNEIVKVIRELDKLVR